MCGSVCCVAKSRGADFNTIGGNPPRLRPNHWRRCHNHGAGCFSCCAAPA
ncbi:hypothetical protein MIZ01_0580 [Sideroxyarcus emersonii]|uniref:Uncharacterized protein n=1 Tax=Sideroxyarcus emersonii TaxID=2764705 RepID=A0AAN2BY67_9PROT|nr:hypothetical protein MIZ01_0580 [Sideroxyarcus emersonii]